MIAALFVARDGVYWNLEGVDPWDEERDARLYEGPHPVVAHPPCARWSRLAGLVEARWGHAKGDDGGTFEAALRAVRTWGGVLEHPAYSAAWDEFGLPIPHKDGGWQWGICGGASCYVEQWRYGHPAKKATWLYVHGVPEPPPMRWGYVHDADAHGLSMLSWCGNKTKPNPGRERVAKKRASATPVEFRDTLLEISRTVRNQSRQQRIVTPVEFRDELLGIARGAKG